MRFFRATKLIIFMLLSNVTFASWDSAVVGKIKQIDVTGAENYGFRIQLKKSDSSSNASLVQCGSHTWSYVNKTTSNYETYVSVLLAAKMSQSTVIIYSNADSSSNGFCHIGYIAIYD